MIGGAAAPAPFWPRAGHCATLARMATNAHVLAAGALGLALGVSAAALLARPDRAPAPIAAAPDRAEAGAAPLADALAAEQAARAALEAETAALRTLLAEAASEVPAPEEPALPDAGAEPPAREEFDAGALTGIGLPDAEIERLRERYAAFQLDELYLRDQARREGWLRDPRYQRELRALRYALRDELGDDAYDALLYATDQDNRVVINRPIPGSPAERAGLQAGDAFLRYGGLRILDPFTLIHATAAGTPGELTEVRVERGGEEIRVFMPRGPLGTTLRRDRRPPDTR